MNKTDDIANLLSRFGANAGSYLEIENAPDYKELPLALVRSAAPVDPQSSATEAEDASPIVTQPKMALAPLSVAVASTLNSTTERIDPVLGDSPAVSVAASVTLAVGAVVPVTSSSLRALLNEMALKRQAEVHARNEEALRQSRANGLPSVTPARVIAIVSPKGGVGKTTIAGALADALSTTARTIAIDLDPQNALQYHMGVNADTPHHGWSNEDWNSSLQDGVGRTRILPYGAISEKERRTRERYLQEDSHWLARQLVCMNLNAADMVILDTPPGRTIYLEQALDVADQVIVVVTPDAGSFMVLDQIDALLEEHANRCSYIVNQFDASRTFCQDMLEVFKHRLGTKLIGVIPLDHAISEGLALGTAPLLKDEKSRAHQEILAISEVLRSHAKASLLAGGRAS